MWFKPKHGPGTSHPPVLIDGQQLQEVEEKKYLGILFDSKLQWGPQVNYICIGLPTICICSVLTASL